MDWEIGAEVHFTAVDMGLLNKIRAWARRNRSSVKSSRYARDAFEGSVKIYWPTPTSNINTRPDERARTLRELIAGVNPHAIR